MCDRWSPAILSRTAFLLAMAGAESHKRWKEGIVDAGRRGRLSFWGKLRADCRSHCTRAEQVFHCNAEGAVWPSLSRGHQANRTVAFKGSGHYGAIVQTCRVDCPAARCGDRRSQPCPFATSSG